MYSIGIDVGGTNIVAGLLDKDGVLKGKAILPSDAHRTIDEIMNDLVNVCENLIEQQNVSKSAIDFIGICVPGIVDVTNNIFVYTGNLPFDNTDPKRYFEGKFDCPIYTGNDANAACYGEYIAGSAKNANTAVMITLGTGVGGGYVDNSKILSGSYNMGCELGHITLCIGGEQCTCGRKGCWEAYSSATALIREIKKSIENDPNGLLNKLAKENGKVTAKIAFDAEEQGDEEAIRLVEDYYMYLTEGIGNIINIFDPEVVIIGGGISAQGDKLIKRVNKNLHKVVFGGKVNCDLVIATLGNDAGVVGAGMLGRA